MGNISWAERQASFREELENTGRKKLYPVKFTQDEALKGVFIFSTLANHEIDTKKTGDERDPNNLIDIVLGSMVAVAGKKDGGTVELSDERVAAFSDSFWGYMGYKDININSVEGETLDAERLEIMEKYSSAKEEGRGNKVVSKAVKTFKKMMGRTQK